MEPTQNWRFGSQNWRFGTQSHGGLVQMTFPDFNWVIFRFQNDDFNGCMMILFGR